MATTAADTETLSSALWVYAQVKRCLSGRAGVQNVAGLDQIEQFLESVAAQPELPEHIADLHPPPDTRDWLRLYSNHLIDAWIIAWNGRTSTGLHDHDGSVGALRVLQGRVFQTAPRQTGGGQPIAASAGSTVVFDSDHIHCLDTSGGLTATLHAYSPPLSRMGLYTAEPKGILVRKSLTCLGDEAGSQSTGPTTACRL
jgi:hypothetical protein